MTNKYKKTELKNKTLKVRNRETKHHPALT